MCVIMLVREGDPRPTQAMLAGAWGRNDHGAGIAWREKKRGKTMVHWKKGLGQKEMEELCKTVPIPYVAHWRIASIGAVLPELTHPFPIDINSPNDALEGVSTTTMLFHNGTWGNWDETSQRAAIAKNIKMVPGGRWSDTRAIAWLMALYGNHFMELLPQQKGIAFGPDDIDFYIGPGWVQINGVWCSNDGFMKWSKDDRKVVKLIPQMCMYQGCTINVNIDSDKRCLRHPKSSFPSDYSVKAPEVALAEPRPFQPGQTKPIIKVKFAEMLFTSRRADGSRRLSRNLLKKIKKAHLRMALGGHRGDKARILLETITPTLLRFAGRGVSTPPPSTTLTH